MNRIANSFLHVNASSLCCFSTFATKVRAPSSRTCHSTLPSLTLVSSIHSNISSSITISSQASTIFLLSIVHIFKVRLASLTDIYLRCKNSSSHRAVPLVKNKCVPLRLSIHLNIKAQNGDNAQVTLFV